MPSLFDAVEMAPRDPILGLNEQFIADPNPAKVNLGVGVYYDENGKLPLLRCIREAEKMMMEAPQARGYLPIDGIAAYDAATQALVFGEAAARREGRIATVQAVGGTGGLKIGADLLHRLNPSARVLISEPSWENHRALFEGAGFEVGTYPYYDATTKGVDFESLRAALAAAAPGTIVVLHACCHNPTGCDLTAEQWPQVVELLASRRLVPFLDMAYQGFGDGIVEDAYALRALAGARDRRGRPLAFFVANSFSKSMSLYGERCGALSVACADRDEATTVLGQLKFTVRRNYSSPPIHGGQIVAAVLSEPTLRREWEAELQAMRERIQSMRRSLHGVLAAKMPDRDFGYFLSQRGMFSYTGLSPRQVDRLREQFAVYVLRSGRMCVAGLNRGNVEATAQAMAAVLAD